MRSGAILLVEDTPDARGLLSGLLRSQGFVVRQAVGALDAFSQLECGLIPDLIVTAFMMPFMDGRRFCRKLRSDWRYRNIPVIVVSAVAMEVIQSDLSPAERLDNSSGVLTLLDAIEDL
jgi:two-component system, chemotaxis family, chemotaxis protein CheY